MKNQKFRGKLRYFKIDVFRLIPNSKSTTLKRVALSYGEKMSTIPLDNSEVIKHINGKSIFVTAEMTVVVYL